MDAGRHSRLRSLAVGCAAAALVACGGSADGEPAGDDAFVKQCAERFNSKTNSIGLDFVENAGEKAGYGDVAGGEYEPDVWLGSSRLRPEKCVALVTLGGKGTILVLRESFHEGASVGEWAALAGETEGTLEEQLERLEGAQAVGLPDGRVRLR